MINNFIKLGPEDDSPLPRLPIGLLVFRELSKPEEGNEISLIDGNDGTQLTRREVLQEAITIALNLKQLGIKKNDIVTLVCKNSCRYITVMFGVLFVGATLNLLNQDYSNRELKHFFLMCKPKLIISSAKSLPQVLKAQTESVTCKTILMEEQSTPDLEVDGIDQLIGGVQQSEIDAFRPFSDLDVNEDVAYILTSSGTTGFPKAVMLTHANMRIAVIYINDPKFLDVNNQESIVLYVPQFHVYGTLISTASVLWGAKLIVLEKFIPDKFLGAIQEYKVSKLFAVPPILLFLVKTPLLKNYDLSSITDVLCGAASLNRELEEAFENRLNVRVRQLYGMTEFCGAITTTPKNQLKAGSVGTAVLTVQIKVSDTETGQTLGPKQLGEIRAKGAGVMKGYMNNEEETKATFDDDGFVKTGDLGYYDEDGYFFVVDRLKEIIKYKGFQVPPVELETILLTHPAIRDAAVIGIPDERAGELPLAFVVKQPETNISEDEIIKYVADNISFQKRLHGGVRFIDEIPKNPSGKILRLKLKALLDV